MCTMTRAHKHEPTVDRSRKIGENHHEWLIVANEPTDERIFGVDVTHTKENGLICGGCWATTFTNHRSNSFVLLGSYS
jgi:hypothetical protein